MPNLKTDRDGPCPHISRADLFWRPIVDKSLKTPLRLKFRLARLIIWQSLVDVCLLLSLWGIILWLLSPFPTLASSQQIIAQITVVLAGVAVTLWGIKKFVDYWRRPVIPAQLAPWLQPGGRLPNSTIRPGEDDRPHFRK